MSLTLISRRHFYQVTRMAREITAKTVRYSHGELSVTAQNGPSALIKMTDSQIDWLVLEIAAQRAKKDAA